MKLIDEINKAIRSMMIISGMKAEEIGVFLRPKYLMVDTDIEDVRYDVVLLCYKDGMRTCTQHRILPSAFLEDAYKRAIAANECLQRLSDGGKRFVVREL